MSWPHFLHGDPQLRKNLIGMAPDEEKHSFIMDVLPKYGIALRAFARLQMNVAVEKSDGFGWFDKINQEQIYLPVLWFEEGIGGPSKVLNCLPIETLHPTVLICDKFSKDRDFSIFFNSGQA